MKKLGFVLVAGLALMLGISKTENVEEYRVSDVSQNLRYVIGDSANHSDEDLGIAFDINEKNKSVFGDIKEGDEFAVVRDNNGEIVRIER